MSSANISKRLDALERFETPSCGRPFVWYEGQSLDDALSYAKLTPDDGPFFPIRVVGMQPGSTEARVDPIYERDKHLLEPA